MKALVSTDPSSVIIITKKSTGKSIQANIGRKQKALNKKKSQRKQP